MANKSLKSKSHGNRYSPKERANAIATYKEIGPSAASRKLGIPYQTLKRWVQEAGVVPDEVSPQEQAARSHAMAAARTSGKWADFREQEAAAAGAAAEIVRDRLIDLIPGDDAQMLRAVTDAYDKLITNAERLSGQATERIQVWAQTDLDKELRGLVSELEDRVRNQPPPSIEDLTALAAQADDIEDAEVVEEPELLQVEP